MTGSGPLDIAIVGLACRFPGAPDAAAYWELLRAGRDQVTEVPPDRWDWRAWYDPDPAAGRKTNSRWGGFLDGLAEFDAGFFNISPREARLIDPQQRLFLEVCWEALEDAGYDPAGLAGTRTGVFAGCSNNGYAQRILPLLTPADYGAGMGNQNAVVANRVSYFLDLRGPSVLVDTMCSSSLVAVDLACRSLRTGESAAALAGGVNLQLSPDYYVAMSRMKAHAADGRCKAFDHRADGIVLGEGVGVVVLKRLEDAQRDGDCIRAIVKGSAVRHGGQANGLTAPNPLAQAEVIGDAIEVADVPATSISYVEAHGTGTALGDPIEIEGLGRAFQADGARGPWCAIGSVKTNLGHLEAAAGIASVVKVVLALEHGVLPPSLHLERPNPLIRFEDTPFRVNTRLSRWEAEPGDPRRAGISSFGMGGTNAHLVVEEAPPAAPPTGARQPAAHLFTASARTPTALRALAARYERRLSERPDLPLGDVCFTATVGRAHFEHRLALVCRSVAELGEALAAHAAGEPSPRLRQATVDRERWPRVAFLFPGQGAQRPGAGRELHETEPAFREALADCDHHLRPLLGRPVAQVLFAADGGHLLDDTGVAQPSLFALEYAMARLWRSWGVEPDAVLGHSLGEYVAACLAGVLSLEDALTLVAERGRLMGDLPPGGAMVAVLGDPERVAEAVRPYQDTAAVAAINGPGQAVVSGAVPTVERVIAVLRAAGLRTVPLRTAGAFHSPLMEPILDRFAAVVASAPLHPPRVALVSNLSGELAGDEVTSPAYWARHLREPVRFAEGVRTLVREGHTLFLEVGPGGTLAQLGRACDDRPESKWLPSLRQDRDERAQLLESLAALHLEGVEVAWPALHPAGARRLPLPTYPFERERHWLDVRPAPPVAAHPLLGGEVTAAGRERLAFEPSPGPAGLPSLADHRLRGRPVLPAAAYLEMALAAARRAGLEVVADLAIHAPLLLDPASGPRLRCAVIAADGAGARLECAGRDPQERIVHATATLLPAEPVADHGWGRAAADSCREEVDVAGYYQDLAAVGFDFGPGYRAIRRLWRGPAAARAEVELPGELIAEAAGVTVHPALLDGCLQTAGAALTGTPGGPLVPAKVHRFRLHRPPGPRVRCVARLGAGPAAAGGVRADLLVTDQAGALVAELDGVELLPLAAEAPATAVRDWFYEVRWEERAPSAPAADQPGCWLLLADHGGIADELAAALERQGKTVVRVRAGGRPDGRAGEHRLLDPATPDGFRRLLAELAAATLPPLRTVVHLWSLDASEADPRAALDLGCRSTLHLVQALAGQGLARPPRLCLVTRGAQPPGAPPGWPAVLQAPLLGLGRVIALEHPDLRCLRVDLPPGPVEIGALLAELRGEGDEEVALRADRRLVPRLVPSRAGEPDDSPRALTLTSPGLLDRLELRPASRRAPGPGEVELRVLATGLNFKDVLAALGTYPGDPGPLGGECVGRVVAVGPGVDEPVPGDRVVALAPGCFATFVTVPACLVRPIPRGLRVEEAATVPIAFLTAAYALRHLAGIRAGERILIHAATGGVGMAAVQLAQLAGLEVFATAGNEDKRRVLRGLSVPHTMDSRRLAFADQVLEASGGEGVDVVLNSLTGEAIPHSLAALRHGGRFVEIGRVGAWSSEQVAAARPDVAYTRVALDELAARDPALVGELWDGITQELEAGRLRPLPHTTFPLDRAAHAFRYMANARHVGKVVVVQPEAGAPPAPLRPDATYLVTGGLGALGLEVARWMAAEGARHIVLVGLAERSELPAPVRSAVQELEAGGVRVRVAGADVADEDRLAALLDDLDRVGPPLRGVVHAAGLLDDGVLTGQSWQRIAEVLAPKVLGGWNLHRLTRERQLDFLILFASMVGVLGAPSQAGYAAANSFLDALAQRRHGEGLPGLSIDWGPWAAGMAEGSRGEARWAGQGVYMLRPELGLRALALARHHPAPQVGVLPVDWSRFFAAVPPGMEPALLATVAEGVRPGAGPRTADAVHTLQAALPGERRAELVELLAGEAAAVLGLPGPDRVDPRRSLVELGMDSLTATEFRNRLYALLGHALPATLVFDFPTVDALAHHIGEVVFGWTGDRAPADALAGVVDDLERLSDEEADALAARRSARGPVR
jgi:acyl transferase domain-containing protein/acyl carrier protein